MHFSRIIPGPVIPKSKLWELLRQNFYGRDAVPVSIKALFFAE